MKFELLDEILELGEDRIVAVKQVSRAEEYLGDHFPSFPILPGVMMLETMVQAARRLLAPRGDERLVLGKITALKFGGMVRPGESLVVEVTLVRELPGGEYMCRGVGRVRRHAALTGAQTGIDATDATAATGRFTMRPLRREKPVGAGQNEDRTKAKL